MRYPLRTLLAALLVTSAVWAQDTSDVAGAREIAKQGLRAFDSGEWAVAEAQLARAYAVVRVSTIALYRARALVKLGRLVEAAELYLKATRLEVVGTGREGQEQAKLTAGEEREALLPRIPRLVIVAHGAPANEVEVEVDGTVVPAALFVMGRQVDPGEHTVVARFGARRITEKATVGEGERRTVRLSFEQPPADSTSTAAPPSQQQTVTPGGARPAPLGQSVGSHSAGSSTQVAPPPSTDGSGEPASDAHAPGTSLQRMLGWTGIGVGGAGLLLGTITGLVALSQQRTLDREGCQDGVCYDEQRNDVKSYNVMRNLSTAGFVVGGVVGAAGAALLLTAPTSPDEGVALRGWVGLGSAGVSGRF